MMESNESIVFIVLIIILVNSGIRVKLLFKEKLELF